MVLIVPAIAVPVYMNMNSMETSSKPRLAPWASSHIKHQVVYSSEYDAMHKPAFVSTDGRTVSHNVTLPNPSGGGPPIRLEYEARLKENATETILAPDHDENVIDLICEDGVVKVMLTSHEYALRLMASITSRVHGTHHIVGSREWGCSDAALGLTSTAHGHGRRAASSEERSYLNQPATRDANQAEVLLHEITNVTNLDGAILWLKVAKASYVDLFESLSVVHHHSLAPSLMSSKNGRRRLAQKRRLNWFSGLSGNFNPSASHTVNAIECVRLPIVCSRHTHADRCSTRVAVMISTISNPWSGSPLTAS